MTSAQEKSETLSALDRPNSYIGKTVPRPNLDRLMQGRGLYVSDVELPRMAHVVFLRSPHAHAKINGIDASAAKQMPGVIASFQARSFRLSSRRGSACSRIWKASNPLRKAPSRLTACAGRTKRSRRW